MENSLTDKLRTFKGFGTKERANSYKFMPTIEAVSYEELTSVQKALGLYGIEMKRPSQIKIAAMGSKEVERRLKYAKEKGILDKVERNPLYLLNYSVFAVEREGTPVTEEKAESGSNEVKVSANGGLTIDTAHFDKFQTMSSCVNGVFEMLAGRNISKEGVFANLEKNILSGDYSDDAELLFHTITDGKDYSEDLLGEVKEAIQEVLKNIKER